MKNYLFFRTDRIGDFLLSAILMKSIKRNDSNAHIIVVASLKNYEYIKTLKLIDEVILYPANFFSKLNFFKDIFFKQFKSKIALDGKKRSIYACILGRADYKFLLTTKIFYKKLLKYFFTNIIFQNDFYNKILEIKFILKKFGFNLKKDDYNIFNNEINYKIIDTKNNNILLHFDEKWIYKDYVNEYENIEPTFDDFYKFILDIADKTQRNIHISSGFKNNDILNKLKLEMTLSDKYYFKDYNSKKIFLHTNLSFIDLKEIIYNSDKIICCHGAPTHLASAMGKEIIDIYEKSEELSYKKWNSHFRNYKFLYRSNFTDLSNKILQLL